MARAQFFTHREVLESALRYIRDTVDERGRGSEEHIAVELRDGGVYLKYVIAGNKYELPLCTGSLEYGE